jgi:hypothetical protein
MTRGRTIYGRIGNSTAPVDLESNKVAERLQ